MCAERYDEVMSSLQRSTSSTQPCVPRWHHGNCFPLFSVRNWERILCLKFLWHVFHILILPSLTFFLPWSPKGWNDSSGNVAEHMPLTADKQTRQPNTSCQLSIESNQLYFRRWRVVSPMHGITPDSSIRVWGILLSKLLAINYCNCTCPDSIAVFYP